MRAHTRAALYLTGLCLAGAASAQSAKVLSDLQAVIALQGKPCGEVTGAERRAENDYLVNCANGARYRVRVGADGRVSIAAQ